MLSTLCLWKNVPAQENVISTDSVDIFSEGSIGDDARKSPTLVMTASLLLPGIGHQYFERNRSALAYYTAEAMAIFGFFVCKHYSDKLTTDAIGYAWIHSGARGAVAEADDNYWQAVGKFMDVQEYNTVMDLNRTPDKKISEETRVWHWDDKSSQDDFNAIRSSSRTFHVASSFFIGAMVLNRVVAFIHIRTATRSRGVKRTGLSVPRVQPLVMISPSAIDLRLTGSF
jgi:hypothetical protein